MAKKQRKKLPKLEQIKKKIKGKVYVGNETEKVIIENKALKAKNDSLQTENDSLKQVIKVRVK